MSEEHDERTEVEAAQHDPSRFAELYEQNFCRVYSYIVRRVGNRHQAEDLTADVFRQVIHMRFVEQKSIRDCPGTRAERGCGEATSTPCN